MHIFQVKLSSHPGSGLSPSTSTLSLRQVRWTLAEDGEVTPVLALGQLDARMCRGPSGHQLDLMLSGTSLDHNRRLVELVTDAKEFVRPLLLQSSPGKVTSPQPLSLALVVSHTRLAWSDRETGLGLMLEVREVEATGSASSHETSVTDVNIKCLRREEDTLTLMSLPDMKIIKKEADVRISVSQRVKLSWQPSVHILATRCAADLQRLTSIMASPQPKPPETAGSKQTVLHLNLQEKITLQCSVSDHSVKMTLTALSAKYTGENSISWAQAPRGRIKVDNSEILNMEDLVLSAVPRSEKLSAERRRMEGAVLESNKCFLVAVKSFTIIQPYQFNFYQVVLQEFVGVFKWLKLLHKKEKSNTESDLPRDILINIQHFKFEFADDPFEIKLRDNYVLREDEYLESQKRLQIFGQRIEEFRKKNLMFPKEKIDELLTNLSKRNADIYVQRAKELGKVQSRTPLFECNLGRVEMAVLADPSMQGRDAVLGHMMQCDPGSPWPDPSSLSFTTLWCRWVKFEAEFITFHLRDFPQHLLDIKSLLLWGTLAVAETEPGKRATRSHVVRIGQGFDDVIIERGMTPLKFFYELACDVESWSMAYGLCWEPAITQFSLALNYLTGDFHQRIKDLLCHCLC